MIRCHVYHLKQLFDISLTQTNRFIKIPTQKSNIAFFKDNLNCKPINKINKIICINPCPSKNSYIKLRPLTNLCDHTTFYHPTPLYLFKFIISRIEINELSIDTKKKEPKLALINYLITSDQIH